MKEAVLEDYVSHVCKGDPDHKEGYELKDHTSKNEVGWNIYEDTETSFCRNISEHHVVGEELRNMETHHVNIEDSTCQVDNRDEEV